MHIEIISGRNQEQFIKRLRNKGIPQKSIDKTLHMLFEGITMQIYNTPIDSFIEDYLYKEFAELRPYQFLSIYAILNEGRQSIKIRKKHN